MRDGIPRTIPVPRKWQQLVECAVRKADRGTERVVDSLLEAVRYAFAKYFPTEARRVLIELVEDSQASFPGFVRIVPPPSTPGTYRLAELLNEAQALNKIGSTPFAAIRDALAAKIEADIAARYRQIFEDLAGKCRPYELQRVREEMYRVSSLIDSKSEAERILTPSVKSATKKIHGDEDLRK